MDEETKTTPESTETTATAAAVKPTKGGNKKLYIGALIIVFLVVLGVLYLLEKEERSPTNLFGDIIAEQVATAVVATVNGDKITNQELTTSMNQFSQVAAAQGIDISAPDAQAEIRRQALEILINTTLLKQEAENRDLAVSAEEVTNRLNEIETDLGGEELLTARMAEIGIGRDQLESDVHDELLIQDLLDEVFSEAAISVTEEEITETYESVGGEAARLPPLEEVRAEVEAQVLALKEQEVVTGYIEELRAGAEIEVVE